MRLQIVVADGCSNSIIEAILVGNKVLYVVPASIKHSSTTAMAK